MNACDVATSSSVQVRRRSRLLRTSVRRNHTSIVLLLPGT